MLTAKLCLAYNERERERERQKETERDRERETPDGTRKLTSRKHAYIILTPLKPHFYIVKLGFTGVYISFRISAQNIDFGYSLEHLTEAVLTSTYNLCFEQKYGKYQKFSSEIFHFLVVKFSQYI